MKYETLISGTTIQFGDEAYHDIRGTWERFPNHMIGWQVCMVRARRPIAEDFTVPNYAKACEGDRIGPFSTCTEASRFAFQIAKTHTTHIEWQASAVYLVVNRHYAEVA